MNKILIVESDFELAEKLRRSLVNAETAVICCGTMESATALLEKDLYHLVVVDTELTDGNGYDLIYELELGIYESADATVIAILPNDKKPDMAEIRERGISDYITKPFSAAVLKAKIYTHFTKNRREKKHISSRYHYDVTGHILTHDMYDRRKIIIDDYVFDFVAGDYSVAGKKIVLTQAEQALLRLMINNQGVVIKKNVLLDQLRSKNSRIFIDSAILADMVETLTIRLKAQRYLKTVYGVGYMWVKTDNTNKNT
jgi:DNA-binding response OmpR family regulator